MSPRLSGKTEGLNLRPTKYESMRMKIGVKNSKTTSVRNIEVPQNVLHDCLSSWLTATQQISKNEFVTDVDPDCHLHEHYKVQINNDQEKEEEIQG